MSRPKLRLDIQGLRALAVALVVIFHLTPKTVPGGYIGVDVFFVISGYLITAHLLREVTRTGRVRLAEFWARRVRRLLPAAFLVLAVSTAAVYFILPDTLREQNFLEIAFATVYALNWRLAADSVDYLAADNAPSIAQHYWSLSVEEQFYIVWPLLIIAAIWIAARSRRISREQAITGALVFVFIASLAFSIYETARSQPSAYFITTTRAWEFAVGGLAALIPATAASKLTKPLHAALSWLGLAAIVGAALLFTGDSAFPGWIALIPVIGTALLLWIGDSDHTWSPQFLAKAGPIQLVGDTSYAVYLWHWPLIIVATSMLGRAPGWIWGSIIVAATIGLAVATKYLVEDPVRRAPGFLKLRLPTFGLMAAGMAAILALTIIPVNVGAAQTADRQAAIAAGSADAESCFGAFAVLNDCADPYAYADTVDPTATQADEFWPYRDHLDPDPCISANVANRMEVACDTDRGGSQTVMLLGDSHMYAMYAGFDAAAQEASWNLSMRARSGCAGFGVVSQNSAADRAERCAVWSGEVQRELLANDAIDTVVFTSYERNYAGSEAQATAMLKALSDAGKRVIVMRDVPGAGTERQTGPECVEAAGNVNDACAVTVDAGLIADADSTTLGLDTWLATAVADANAAGTEIEVIDPRDVLCTGDVCHVVIGGTIVYQDSNHVAATFARTLAPWFEEKLAPLV